MEFEKWMQECGYYPIGFIKSRYRSMGESEESIRKRENEIKAEYKEWCKEKGIEPHYRK